MGKRRNPFRGVMDTMSEMARMRDFAEGGSGGLTLFSVPTLMRVRVWILAPL